MYHTIPRAFFSAGQQQGEAKVLGADWFDIQKLYLYANLVRTHSQN